MTQAVITTEEGHCIDIGEIAEIAMQAAFAAIAQALDEEGFPVTGDFSPDETYRMDRQFEYYVRSMALNNPDLERALNASVPTRVRTPGIGRDAEAPFGRIDGKKAVAAFVQAMLNPVAIANACGFVDCDVQPVTGTQTHVKVWESNGPPRYILVRVSESV